MLLPCYSISMRVNEIFDIFRHTINLLCSCCVRYHVLLFISGLEDKVLWISSSCLFPLHFLVQSVHLGFSFCNCSFKLCFLFLGGVLFLESLHICLSKFFCENVQCNWCKFLALLFVLLNSQFWLLFLGWCFDWFAQLCWSLIYVRVFTLRL